MYPKMLPEIIEAIETHFDDEKDVVVDCLLYLKNATCREEDVAQIEKWFIDHGRCFICGDELLVSEYKEAHPECGAGVYEAMTAKYCPNCDTMGVE